MSSFNFEFKIILILAANETVEKVQSSKKRL